MIRLIHPGYFDIGYVQRVGGHAGSGILLKNSAIYCERCVLGKLGYLKMVERGRIFFQEGGLP